MDRKEFLKKCQEVCVAGGKDLPNVVMDKALAFAWEVMAYGHNEDSTKESLTQSCAEMYIALMAISYLFDLEPETMEKYVKKSLGIKQDD